MERLSQWILVYRSEWSSTTIDLLVDQLVRSETFAASQFIFTLAQRTNHPITGQHSAPLRLACRAVHQWLWKSPQFFVCLAHQLQLEVSGDTLPSLISNLFSCNQFALIALCCVVLACQQDDLAVTVMGDLIQMPGDEQLTRTLLCACLLIDSMLDTHLTRTMIELSSHSRAVRLLSKFEPPETADERLLAQVLLSQSTTLVQVMSDHAEHNQQLAIQLLGDLFDQYCRSEAFSNALCRPTSHKILLFQTNAVPADAWRCLCKSLPESIQSWVETFWCVNAPPEATLGQELPHTDLMVLLKRRVSVVGCFTTLVTHQWIEAALELFCLMFQVRERRAKLIDRLCDMLQAAREEARLSNPHELPAIEQSIQILRRA